ncbi:ribosome modulation factor [Hansschlegelia sp. KR7-227]|uniref:ribosome modulation factor n=1 Tax=Hansschlegelia sp. KR7-227 TaxID=3400914 RepID=UPI003C0E2C48
MTDQEDAHEGRQAFVRGEAATACPHRTGRRREAWLRGWYGAQDARRSFTARSRGSATSRSASDRA